jgi:flap endonuclease-1
LQSCRSPRQYTTLPPRARRCQLAKRHARNQEAKDNLAAAEETGNAEDIEKFSKRTVRASREQSDECKRLLTLMGLPVVQAPCEAEAQCAELVKGDVCFATATEDMDALTFATTRLVRNFTQPESRKLPILEYCHADLLEGLGMTQAQFIDLCILLGCDYCDTIRGVGPVKAIDLMRKAKAEGIERIVKDLDPKKYTIPDEFPFEAARGLFNAPEVTPFADVEKELVWKEPDCVGLKAFLVDEKGFGADRVDSAIAKLQKTKSGGRQQRMENFFSVKTVIKRKIVELPSSKNKKGKGAAGAFKKKK